MDYEDKVKEALSELGAGDVDRAFKLFDNHCEGAFVYNRNFIVINLKEIYRDCTEYYVNDFYKQICNCITHEYVHKWLYDNISEDAMWQWDNIAYTLREYGDW